MFRWDEQGPEGPVQAQLTGGPKQGAHQGTLVIIRSPNSVIACLFLIFRKLNSNQELSVPSGQDEDTFFSDQCGSKKNVLIDSQKKLTVPILSSQEQVQQKLNEIAAIMGIPAKK